MDISLFNFDGLMFVFRWIHFLAGVTWIGILYYFNFIQGAWFKEIEAGVKTTALQTLVPRALWWFRWSAMLTFLSGFIILMMKGHQGGFEIYSSSWGICILTGASMGTFMFLNVWMIIWPKQKIVIASANATASGGKADPQVAQCAAAAGLASRTNTLFSIPMLFFMGAASHLPINISYDYSGMKLFVVLAIIIGLLELNGIKGKLGPMSSVKGVIHCGFLLTIVLYIVIEALT